MSHILDLLLLNLWWQFPRSCEHQCRNIAYWYTMWLVCYIRWVWMWVHASSSFLLFYCFKWDISLFRHSFGLCWMLRFGNCLYQAPSPFTTLLSPTLEKLQNSAKARPEACYSASRIRFPHSLLCCDVTASASLTGWLVVTSLLAKCCGWLAVCHLHLPHLLIGCDVTASFFLFTFFGQKKASLFIFVRNSSVGIDSC